MLGKLELHTDLRGTKAYNSNSNRTISNSNIQSNDSRQHNADLNLAHRYRLSLTSAPIQSNFRVVALVFFDANESSSAPIASCFDDSGRRYLVGTNDEPCNMTGSICAERAALVQLRWIPTAKVTKLVIVTDATHAVTPGVLCREFMASKPYISSNTPIVLGGTVCHQCQTEITDSNITVDCHGESHNFLETVTNIATLYPHQSIYTGLTMEQCIALGSKWTAACIESEDTLRKLARTTADKDQRKDLHPISYGAAVYFRDKTYASSLQKKALEFGGTLDAVSQLAPILEAKRSNGIGIQCIVMCDQFGIAHPPFAGARAYLVEHGFGNANVLVHQIIKRSGGIGWTKIKAIDLVPSPPVMGELNQL